MAVGNALNLPLPLTNGQLWVGNGTVIPSAATLTAGTGISITNGSGTITVAATGATTFTEVTGTSQAMSTNSRYMANNAGLVTLTLPTTSAIGDIIEIYGKGAGGWTIDYTTNQLVRQGNVASTITTGNVASNNQYDCVKLVCLTTNLTWEVSSSQGSLTFT